MLRRATTGLPPESRYDKKRENTSRNINFVVDVQTIMKITKISIFKEHVYYTLVLLYKLFKYIRYFFVLTHQDGLFSPKLHRKKSFENKHVS